MAIMLPAKPREFDPASKEGLMFEALEQLPDDYYVFHSFQMTSVRNNTVYENEIDFVIFNPSLGIICLEAKAGSAISYSDGEWRYSNGLPMAHGGPFHQADRNKWNLLRYIERSKAAALAPKCKFLHAVWFPGISDNDLRGMTMPSEADRALVMTKEALSDPKSYIDRIFAIELPNGRTTDLQPVEAKRLLREVLCPQFDICPSASFDSDLKKIVFHRLLKEQTAVLNFLHEQKSAAINGAAGTGKTMIALEKAQRHACNGEKVLFLCYNAELCKHIKEKYSQDNLDIYTVIGYICKLGNSREPDYDKAKGILEEMFVTESFPYKHVVIDEGQDFGYDDLEASGIMEIMRECIEMRDDGSSFFVFYDKLQKIQARSLPVFIEEADCRLTLYRNCRNTINIATTSLKPVTERDPKLMEGAVAGVPAQLHFCDEQDQVVAALDKAIADLKEDGISDVVILTCKTEKTSIIAGSVTDGMYKRKYKFSTCRKFKGLEADAVILVDVDETTFNPDKMYKDSDTVFLYYVGASRARLRLEILAQLSDEECTNILQKTLNYRSKIRKPRRELAAALGAMGKIG